MKLFKRSLGYLRPHRKLAVTSIVLIVLISLASLLAPWPLAILVDSVLGDKPLDPRLAAMLDGIAANRTSLLILVVMAGLAITLLENGLSIAQNYINTKIEQRMVLDVRSELFQHVQRLSLAFHDKRRTGRLIFAINNQGHAATSLIMAVQPLAQSVLTLVGMFWITFQIDRQLALLSITVVPVLYYSVSYYANRILPRLREVRGLESESLSLVHEAISMLRVIVAFGREDHEYRRFRNQGEKAVDARVKVTVGQDLFSLSVNMTTAIGSALVLGYGAYRTLQGQMTVGNLLVVTSYIAAIYKPLETISYTFSSVQENLVSLEMVFGLLDTDAEIKDAPDAIAIERAKGRVTFDDVHFSYTGRVDTLKGISFEAQAGEVIAVVGPTGAGKTTLVSLIPRFYQASQGRILLDGIDTRQITLKSLREQISIVLQEPLLFSGTIADNIRYGKLDATMDEIMEAAKDANVHDFIMKLPDKYETQIGERGAQLSGGERQRISVARAFLKDAPILILDEPTSSIDSKTEAVILEALERLMTGRTTFMVAHRLSTIRHADTILVLDHGCLIEHGTHDELLQREGLYVQLHQAQTRQAQRNAQQILQAESAPAEIPPVGATR